MADDKKTRSESALWSGGQVVSATSEGRDLDEDVLAAGKAQDTHDLGAKAAAATSKPKPVAETDPSKMSPLDRASYLAKKKAQAASGAITTDDAAKALANR